MLGAAVRHAARTQRHATNARLLLWNVARSSSGSGFALGNNGPRPKTGLMLCNEVRMNWTRQLATGGACRDTLQSAVFGTKVGVWYSGEDPGTNRVVDSIPKDKVFEFVIGSKKALPGIEAGVTGMQVGESKTLFLSPKEAFGEYKDGMVATVSKTSIPDDIQVGEVVQYEDGQIAFVKELQKDRVVLDLNHPLAGRAIVYTVKLVSVNEVPQMEIVVDSPGNGADYPKIGDRVTLRVDVYEEKDPHNVLGGGTSPFDFVVGQGHNYLPGIDDIVMKMSLGENAHVRIPPEMGLFQERNRTIVYKIDLLEIRKREKS